MEKKNIKQRWLLVLALAPGILGSQIFMVHAAEDEYLLPQSASEYITESDVAGFSQQKLNYARNEIFARHGRCFKSQELMEYFNATDWYVGNIKAEEFDDTVLNDFEWANVYFLSDLEYRNDPEGYVLDQPGYDIYQVAGQNLSGVTNKEVKLAEEEAWDAVYDYLDGKLGMQNVYNYQGGLTASDHNDNEYVFGFRSYTGAHAYYYVNKHTGDVYESQENPITSIYEEKTYI